MNATLKILIPVTALSVVAIVGTVAWQHWPPVLRYREKRVQATMQRVVERYLRGEQEFEPAAAQLAQLMTEAGELWYRLSTIPTAPAGGGVLIGETMDITPTGFEPHDPRIDSLSRRALVLSARPEARAWLEEQMRQHPPRRPPN